MEKVSSFAQFFKVNMPCNSIDTKQNNSGKELYDYQKQALAQIMDKLKESDGSKNLLYQLPTGGGKTVIFSEIARRYLADFGRKVLILTHRIELCNQTSRVLHEFGVKNKVINSKVKELDDEDDFPCYVAMVETLNNRLQDDILYLDQVGLVVVDEAHYNSFRKLFKYFENSNMLGVTATPLSSNINLPMKDNYDELLVGESISDLISKGFLAKANTYSYNVSLRSLKVGISGDYTVNSSERLYSNYLMQEKLLLSYEATSKSKKTLIFNNGINTSRQVEKLFQEAGYDIRHLDNTNSANERKEILEWFKTKSDAILTSVGILTTGFDEPTVESIIINRATKSLTLYHQMIGRGSRVLPSKKEFNVIDLGNNAARFGLWDMYVNWYDIFKSPDYYLSNLISDEEIEAEFVYEMPEDVRGKFSVSSDVKFDIKEEYARVTKAGLRPKAALDASLEQHARICCENSEDLFDALDLAKLLADEIENRVKRYSQCICKSTPNYLSWLQTDYQQKLRTKITQNFQGG